MTGFILKLILSYLSLCCCLASETKMDSGVIQASDDTTLSKFIPKQGDRIAVKQFCRTKDFSDAPQSKKQTLLTSLRKKLHGAEVAIDRNMPKKVTHLVGNANALKKTRKIELGWLHYNKGFKQVRKCKGGGTRKIDIIKTANKYDILEEAKHRFFPNGQSKLGPLTNFEIDIRDFSEEILSESDTVINMYEKTGMGLLKFYVSTKPVMTHEVAEPLNPENSHQSGAKKITAISHALAEQGNKAESASTSSPAEAVTPMIEDDSPPSSPLEIILPEKGKPMDQHELPKSNPPVMTSINPPVATEMTPNQSNPHDVMLIENESPLSSTLDLNDFFESSVNWEGAFHSTLNGHYRHEDISFNVVLQEFQNEPVVTPSTSDCVSVGQMETSLSTDTFVIHVKRNDCLNDMLTSFKDGSVFKAKEVVVETLLPNGEKENGVGEGVVADCLTGFWEEFYDKCTVGMLEKVPYLRHDFKKCKWQAVARILLFGWERYEFLPTELSKVFLLTACGVIPNTRQLMDSFLQFLGDDERKILQDAMQSFSTDDLEDILEIVGRYGCKKMPTEANIEVLLCEIAHKEIIQVPMFVLDSWKNIFMEGDKTLLDVGKVEAVYKEAIPKARSVLRRLCFPEILKTSENNTREFLERYIRESDLRRLKLLLRYCTGYNILNKYNKCINIIFSPMSEFCRRPIGRTCGQTLELGQEYPNYPTFRSELNMVLDSGMLSFDII